MHFFNRDYTLEEVDEHRLEIENRVKNLFWTVSGDYTLDIKPNVYDFARSRYIPLYDAIKQGAFAKYFDVEALALYTMKKRYLYADETALLELCQIAMDMAVYPIIRAERRGLDEIRQKAFTDLLKDMDPDKGNIFTRCRYLLMKDYMKDMPYQIDPQALSVFYTLSELSGVTDTDTIIETIDRLYNQYYDQDFSEKHGDLKQVLSIDSHTLVHALEEEFLTDDQMDLILRKYLTGLRMDLLRLEVDDSSDRRAPAKKQADVKFADPTEESAKRVHEYVELTYGQSYLKDNEARFLSERLCRGLHKGCAVHFTEGILHAFKKKNNQYRYAELQTKKNTMYYFGNHRVVKKNIAELADTLKKVLQLREEEVIWADRTGVLVPARLWKLGRSEDDKFFNKSHKMNHTDFVVDILLDASGSQMKRQPQVAIQGYIISSALTRVGIPNRVCAFNTFWDYTVLHRFRDYDDGESENMRIFEYQANANNRDGLAIRAIADGLERRNEDHKILIVLSDGKPNDVGRSSLGENRSRPYMGREAIKDTAFEVRKTRAMGISVLGIFAGAYDDLEAEKKIFGKDFAYIRNIANFSKVVSAYLVRQLEED